MLLLKLLYCCNADTVIVNVGVVTAVVNVVVDKIVLLLRRLVEMEDLKCIQNFVIVLLL